MHLVTSYLNFLPDIADSAFVDISARIIGKVQIGPHASVWPGAVLRADDEDIIIGEGSAILDLALLEAPAGYPVRIEAGALVSHKVCIHGASVETGALVGIGAIILDGAVVGREAIIAAGALVPPGMQVPSGMLMMGQPAKPVRKVKPEEVRRTIGQLAELRKKASIYQGKL